VDSFGARLRGTQKLTCEMTLRDGRVVYELNGLARPEWTTLPKDYRSTGDRRWDGIGGGGGRRGGPPPGPPDK
jgi:dihydroorotase